MSQDNNMINLVWSGEPSPNRNELLLDRKTLADLYQMKHALNNQGYSATLEHIHDAWEEYCDVDHSAGWLDLPQNDSDIVKALLKYLVKEE